MVVLISVAVVVRSEHVCRGQNHSQHHTESGHLVHSGGRSTFFFFFSKSTVAGDKKILKNKYQMKILLE